MNPLPVDLVEWLRSHSFTIFPEDRSLAISSKRRLLTAAQVQELLDELTRKRLEQEEARIREAAEGQIQAVRAELDDAIAEIRRLRVREQKLEARVGELEAENRRLSESRTGEEKPAEGVNRTLQHIERLIARLGERGNQASRMISWSDPKPDRKRESLKEPKEVSVVEETLLGR